MPEDDPKPVTRRRDLVQKSNRMREIQIDNRTGSQILTQSDSYETFPGTQVTVSSGHDWPPSKGGLRDVGGDFFTTRSYWKLPQRDVIHEYQDTYRNQFTGELMYYDKIRYTGPMYPNLTGIDTSQPVHSSNQTLDNLGATAIARCKPTNPVADVSIALGEIVKDGLPKLINLAQWKTKTELAQKLGDAHLNSEFGWLPFLGELGNIAKAITHGNTVMQQYERDAGRVVRRQYSFPSIEREEAKEYPGDSWPRQPQNRGHYRKPLVPGKLIRIRQIRIDRRFSGAFTYYLPSGYDSRNAMDRAALEAKVLFGATLTPDTVWNLAPWSWAVDWFSNAGDVVSNLSDFKPDGLVMRYGYIMEHTVCTDTYTCAGHSPTRRGHVASPLIKVTETKIRRRANPFGFGVDWNGLSPRQLSIVAALGISRRR